MFHDELRSPAQPVTAPVTAAATGDSKKPLLLQQQGIVVVIDLVESVRLIAANEAAVVMRWRDFVDQATRVIMPQFQGRIVKSLGDGLMLLFSYAAQAAQAVVAMHRYFEPINAKLPGDQQMLLRAGIHAGHFYVDDIDLYGHDVNLAARVATLAGPGETVVTTEVRDHLTDQLDVTLEDLGECYLKHIDLAVRVYRASPVGATPVVLAQTQSAITMQPTVAVIPFRERSNDAQHLVIGDLIADGVIDGLGRTRQLKVISRLSTSAFRHRDPHENEIKLFLGANYVIHGNYLVASGKVLITVELTTGDGREIIWTDRFTCKSAALLQPRNEPCETIVQACMGALIDQEMATAINSSLPTLPSYTLLLSGISMMHHSTAGNFHQSKVFLETLVERHRNHPAPAAWLAMWHVLCATRGFSTDRMADGKTALNLTQRALDLRPENTLALAVQGFVHCHMLGDLNTAALRLNAACEINPSDSIAQLFSGVVRAMSGEGDCGTGASNLALELSPLDPIRYYYESLASSCAFSAKDYAGAIQLGLRSRTKNRLHASTLRVLVGAYFYTDQHDKAVQMAQELMRLDPHFSASTYRQQTATSDGRDRIIFALQSVGIR